MNDRLPIGIRIKAAREAASWTQAKLSDALGFSDRQTLSDIENGKRNVKPQELVIASELLGKDIDYFLNPLSVSGEAKYNWRTSPEVTETSLDAFEACADQWIGLLRWLRLQDTAPNPLKLSLRLNVKSSFEQAQTLAQSLVQVLQLGQVPATKLAEATESKLDIPVLFVDTIETTSRSAISGATCHLPDMTAILINRHEPVCRQHFDLAHELFHALTWDTMQPDHRESNCIGDRKAGKRIEQLADNFAAALLMPLASLEWLLPMADRTNLRRLTEVAKELQVTPSALAWRLFNLHWIDSHTLQQLKAQPNKRERHPIPKRFSSQYMTLLHQAINQGRLSARKAAKALSFTLPELRDLFKEHAMPVPFEI